MAVKLPTPTDPDVRKVLDRQVLVMFELADEVVAGVELSDEPPDVPTPSLAWTMWHPIWWLSVLLGHAHGRDIPVPESVEWPGSESSLGVIRQLWSEWVAFTASLDNSALNSGELTKFPYTDDRPFVHTIGWASMELVKNLTEMCMLRRIINDLSGR